MNPLPHLLARLENRVQAANPAVALRTPHLDEPGHHLRCSGTKATGDGFAVPRPRPTRRKRGGPIR
ncbi:hypothetical protein JOD54_005046 [Actinokineospora baliensis]|nr:hypothetical protein [Actinokineospora baliensis]